jgi:quercetin dioxygenase-like cupin family protein
MKITNLDKVEKVKLNVEGAKNTYKQIPISMSDGSPAYSFRVFTVEPNGHTLYHQHAFEHLNYIIEGNGAVVMENGSERPVKKGDFALILPGETHQYRNKSADKPLILICAVPKEYE